MDGLYRLCGTGATITMGGQVLTVHGRTLRHCGEMEGYYLSQRGNPFELSRSLLPRLPDHGIATHIGSDMVKMVRHEYFHVGTRELMLFRDSWEGRLFALWHAVRHHGLSHQQCSDMFWDTAPDLVLAEHRWASIRESIDQASGEHELSSLEFIHDIDMGDGQQNWQLIMRRLTEEPFGFDVNEIMDMTIPQIRLILGKRDDLEYDGRQSETDCQLPVFTKRFRMNYLRAGRNLAAGMRWDVMTAEDKKQLLSRPEPGVEKPSKRLKRLHSQIQQGKVSMRQTPSTEETQRADAHLAKMHAMQEAAKKNSR